MEKVYKVSGMHSNGCATTVERAVRGVPGVRSVQVNLAAEEVRVVFEEGLADEEQLKHALQRLGYPVASEGSCLSPTSSVATRTSRAQGIAAIAGVGGVAVGATGLLVGLGHSLVLLTGPLRSELLTIPRGQWVLAAVSATVFLGFLLLLPARLRRDWRSHGLYTAFVVSLFAEMFGFPFTVYILSSAVGWTLFEREFMTYMYRLGMPVGSLVTLGGMLLVALGWRELHRHKGDLVTTGIYRRLRHPQYLGLVLVVIGWLVHWPTLPGLLMAPFLVLGYVRQALREEAELARRYGPVYEAYARTTPGWIPWRLASPSS